MKRIVFWLILMITGFTFAESGSPDGICPTLIMSGNDVSCYGESNGNAYVNVVGGSGNFTYNWSNGVNFTANTNLPVGTYTVFVKDLNTGCSVVGAYVVGSPDPILTDEIVTNVLCKTQLTGAVNVTTYGGTSPYTFSWSNGTSTEDLNGVAADSYTLNITDFNNCTYSETYTITEPLEVLQGSGIVSDAKCFATATGEIDITAWGGTPAYSYAWSTGVDITEDIDGLPAGNYSVTITDYNECELILYFDIEEPDVLNGVLGTTPVLCNGDATGTAWVEPTGGTTPYSFSWQNTLNLFALNNDTLENIPADIYQVTVTDFNGCKFIDDIEVFQPTEINASYSISNVNCFGGSDGSINVTVGGGSPAYSYVWTNDEGVVVSNSQDLINVIADIYTLVITDNNGCTYTFTDEVTQPLLPITVTYSVTDVLCFGENTGEIDLSVSGGTPPYAYSWSSGQSDEDISNLLSGSYTYTVFDDNGCSESDNIFVDQPAAPLNVIVTIQDVNCFGESNGSILLDVTGGTPDYSFDWQNSTYDLSYTEEDLINFPADSYRFELTDANGCKLIDTLEINQPDELIPSIEPTHILCYGEATGEIDLTVIGGVMPYQYYWSNGPVVEDQTGLIAGYYEVNVIDDQDCEARIGVELLQPEDTISFTYDVVNVRCNDGFDGAIDLFVEGGTPGYSYLWSNGENESSITELTAGQYDFTVTDANACIFEGSIFVDQPDPIELNPNITPVTCYGFSDGIIDLSTTGGTRPYSFAWYDSTYALAYQEEDLVNFSANVYQVEITDSNGCFHEEFIPLPQPDSLIVEAEIKQVTCYGWSDGAVYVDITGGNPGYTTIWSNGTFDEDLIDVVSDTFELIVLDTKGCTDTLSYFVPQPDSMYVLFEHEPVTCIDQADGIGYAYAYGGNGGYSYDWQSGSTEYIAELLEGGYQSIIVTDVLGCEVIDSVFITKLEGPCIDPPNAFTPNTDNYNDDWRIDNVHLYPDLEVIIFNKWGNQVHVQRGEYTPWDGRINGVEAPSDTYYYLININYLDRESVTGNVTIIR